MGDAEAECRCCKLPAVTKVHGGTHGTQVNTEEGEYDEQQKVLFYCEGEHSLSLISYHA